MYTKPMVNTKKILIVSDTTETFRLRIAGSQTVRSYCPDCDSIEEMIDLNAAADVSGAAAREIVTRVESGELHAPDMPSGHLLICRASLETAINADERLRPITMLQEKI